MCFITEALQGMGETQKICIDCNVPRVVVVMSYYTLITKRSELGSKCLMCLALSHLLQS